MEQKHVLQIILNCFSITFAGNPKLKFWRGPDQLFSGKLPDPRILMGLSSVDEKLFVFGGVDYFGNPFGDMYVFSTNTFEWISLVDIASGETLPPRYAFGLTVVDGKLILYGGIDPTDADSGALFNFDPSSISWTRIDLKSDSNPPYRECVGMTSVGSSVYIFGGRDITAVHNSELFLLDYPSLRWSNLTGNMKGSLPSPREGHGFTSLGQFIYLHGGVGGGQPSELHQVYGDLLQLDTLLLSWTNLSLSELGASPPPRSYHGFAACLGSIFVVGGHTGRGLGLENSVSSISLLSDMYVLNASTLVWHNITGLVRGTLPGPRAFHGLTEAGGKLFMFGGKDESGGFVNSLLIFNPRTMKWSDLSSIRGTPPAPCDSMGSAIDEDQRMWIFGGRTEKGINNNRFHVLDSQELFWAELSNNSLTNIEVENKVLVSGPMPSARSGHGMVRVGSNFFLFGGSDDQGVLGDLFSFHLMGRAWTLLDGVAKEEAPSPRSFFGFAALENVLAVIGGVGKNGVMKQAEGRYYGWAIPDDMGDFYLFNTATFEWSNVTSKFAHCLRPMNSPGLVSARGKIYLLGGQSASGEFGIVDPLGFGYLDDFLELDLEQLKCVKLSELAVGEPPSPRFGHGIAAVEDKLFVFGGYDSAVMDRNDLYSFNLDSLEWSQLSQLIMGSSPIPRDSFGFSVTATSILVFGGQSNNGVDVNDLWAVDIPRTLFWPKDSSPGCFLQVYDWDTIQLNPGGDNILTFRLSLCTRMYPCTLRVDGNGRSRLVLDGDGSFYCRKSEGCIKLHILGSDLVCTSSSRRRSAVELDGAELMIHESKFEGCNSLRDGGCVQSYGSGARVNVSRTLFGNCWSASHGGAVSAVGSTLFIIDSVFRNCSSVKGGGAISGADFVNYGQDQSYSTLISVVGSIFENCSSLGSGGAVSAFSSSEDSYVTVYMLLCIFKWCRTQKKGGAVNTVSVSVSAVIKNSSFTACRSTLSGGAVSAEDFSTFQISDCIFSANVALGLGGGVMYVSDASVFLENLDCDMNQAPNGGGGVLFWDGAIEPTEIRKGKLESLCQEKRSNTAAFGPCIASTFRRLQVDGIPNEKNPTFPGLSFSLIVSKLDAYNQTIKSDSTSFLQAKTSLGFSMLEDADVVLSGTAVAALSAGNAIFTLNLKPRIQTIVTSKDIVIFASLPFLFFQGIDSQSDSQIQSDVFSVYISNGSAICPLSYVLSVGQATDLLPIATCQQCGQGMYSIDPLAGYSSTPACLNCLPKMICSGGNINRGTAEGVWIVLDGMYHLEGCPSGRQLMNSIGGVFSHDIQQCVNCSSSQYVVNSNNSMHTCQPCPVGAMCDGRTVIGLIAGSLWQPDEESGVFRLISCPPGYEISTSLSGSGTFQASDQQCITCPATFFCLGGSSQRVPCPQDAYSPPNSNSSAACFPVIYVEVSVTLALSKDAFSIIATQVTFKQALAESVGTVPERVLLQRVVSVRRSDVPSVLVNSRIAAESKGAAHQLISVLSLQSLNSALLRYKLPPISAFSATVLETEVPEFQGVSVMTAALGTSIVGFVFLVGVLFLVFKWHTSGASHRLVGAKHGILANQRDLPFELRHKYRAIMVVGSGANGVVITAKQHSGGRGNTVRAIKIFHSKSRFSEEQLRRLEREASILGQVKSHYIPGFIDAGKCKHNDLFWIVMEYFPGKPLDEAMKVSEFGVYQTIKVGLEMCSALKELHRHGIIHRDVKPANIMQVECPDWAGRMHPMSIKGRFIRGEHNSTKKSIPNEPSHQFKASSFEMKNLSSNLIFVHGNAEQSNASSERNYTYKLVDLGTAVAPKLEDVTLVCDESNIFVTKTEDQFVGTLAYASPEAFRDPSTVLAPADLWSLAVTLFHVISNKLPFDCTSHETATASIACDLDAPAPDVRDAVSETLRPEVSSTFAAVLMKGMAKCVANRYQSADEFATALHGCLVARGEEIYTVFISYRVFSERYHALLLYNVLNNTTTPGGRRVIVYLDCKRLIDGEDWAEGFSSGLFKSLVAVPLISLGVLKPLIRLIGDNTDRVDNVAKELLMMQALHDTQNDSNKAEGRVVAIFPIFVGRPLPTDDPQHPWTGDFQVESSGLVQQLADRVSPPTMDSALDFLTSLGVEAPQSLRQQTVRQTVQRVLGLQGAKLGDAKGKLNDVLEVECDDVWALVEKQQSDPPLEKVHVRAIKAQMCALVPAIHKVIDRAYYDLEHITGVD